MSDDQDGTRLRRLRFRAWHRGTREMDFLMGTFADRHLDELAAPDLDAFERLLEIPDQELFAWIAGSAEPPAEQRSAVLARIMATRLTPDDYS